MIQITSIQFREPKNNHNPELIKLCDVVLDDCLKLKDIQVCKNNIGYYIKFPNKVSKDNQYRYDIYHPINNGFRKYMESEIIEKMIN
ncbi:septation protein SpoVG family protein [Sporolituus thermophilus]|uniref:DNA-binding protein SpoVG, cell septation regulator n=1 Tax=Sporolituus thermophilus DSM 23256 TaxID=1123285 RepID=A0A1G7PIU5_9FIRM|nr:septation protein SpoVG family protein [Sporolituus thermophilus]SDF86157.1 DNA-binding protein SpoVG, cell septation regulator [Sporolituus thermophilus DSM 23256]